MSMLNFVRKKLGLNRGLPRLWFEGGSLERNGFLPGSKYQAQSEGQRLVLTVSENGARVISAKERNDGTKMPILDLNSRELLSAFQGFEYVKVTFAEGEIRIEPLATEVRKVRRVERLRQKLSEQRPVDVGSISHGGGLLSCALHEGLEQGGLESRMAFAVEIREELLDQSQKVNRFLDDKTQIIAAPLQEVAFDLDALSAIGECDIMELGLPCSGASRSGRSKNKIALPEDHPEVGHLVAGALAIVAKANPVAMVYENVPEYQTSASASIIRNQLKDWGYRFEERVLLATDFNGLEERRRWVMVAMTEGIPFSFDDLIAPAKRSRRLGDVLDEVPADSARWNSYQYLKDKEARDADAGKGFRMQIVGPDAEKVGTIGKGYAKVRSTEPKIQHPTNPDLMRQLTAAEHFRIKGFNPAMAEGLSETIAHEMAGQGVCREPFAAVGEWVAHALRAFAAKVVEPVTVSPVANDYGQVGLFAA